MAISHRTNRLKLVGTPAVEQLQNGRYQLTVNCTTMNSREDWYSSNKARIFPDFGSLESAEMSIDGLAPRTGEAYTDMRLVSVQSSTQQDKYIVTLVYQTLGASFVQVKDDTIDLELNGLRVVTRTSIAQAGTDIPDDDKDVGVDYIDHQIDSETAVRCFLASYEIDDTDSYREFERTYIQAGTLSVSIKNLSEGVKQVTTVFLVTEGTTVGPVTARSTDNFEGLKTISVTTMQDKDGNPLGNDGSNPVSTFSQYVDFRYPGQVSVANDTDIFVYPTLAGPEGGRTTWRSFWYGLVPPITVAIEATVYVFFQTSTDIVDSDLTYDGAIGLWNPTSWAKGRIDGLGTNFALTTVKQTAQDKVFSEYTAVEPLSASGTATYADSGTGAVLLEGQYIVPSARYAINVSGGPGLPDGGKYVVSPPTLNLAFDDVDGNQVWKKTIVVATVPTR